MNNLSEIKHSHNIVDIIGSYLPLKKSGHNYFACCPFHNEKSPSFTVDEAKQFYHCFGCGAHGDVISFVVEYTGVDFVQACKDLGAQVDLMPSKKVIANIAASKNINSSLPSYDKRAPEKSAEFLSKCQQIDDRYQLKDSFYYAITDLDGEIVNAVSVTGDIKFVAGGVSHLAGVWMSKNDTNQWFVVVDFWDGVRISHIKNINVLVSFSVYNTRLICQYTDSRKYIPILRYDDTQAEQLCDEGAWIYMDQNGKLTKKKIGEYLD